MVWLREVWAGVRETVFVTAQVVTLGVLALVLGLIALNVLVHRPAAPASPSTSQPSRPLTALVATLVPDTPTPAPTVAATATAPMTTATPRPAETLAGQPPARSDGGQPSPTPPATPTQAPAPTAPAQPTEAPPAAAPPGATATSAVPAQMMKVLPASDGLPARVRAEPSGKAPILIRVPLGSTVEVLGTTSGEELQPGNARWVKVRWKGTTGYVYSTLVGEP